MEAHPNMTAEVVLLLHGMGRTHLSMRSMRRHLEREGFHALDWSMSCAIDEHVNRLQKTLHDLDMDNSVSRIHLVTHSLGGIITRKALLAYVPAKMGRVVMLAPPNRGSRVAKRVGPLLGRWIKPLADLSDAPGSAVNRLGTPKEVEIGIIAARRDGKVRVEDTHLPGESDHITVPGFHTFIMNSRSVQERTVRFLRNGAFR